MNKARRNCHPSRTSQTRRGMSVVIVLGLLAITLALAYAMMRSESTVARIQQNYDRRGDAKHAAMTGMSLALRKMQAPDWAGVNVPMNADLGGGVSYQVRFETGDTSLTSDSADIAEYPYRVTVTSTGTAADPTDANIVTTHRIQAVAQLVRRKLSDPLERWSEAQRYSVYQWGARSDGEAKLGMPFQIQGPARFTSELELPTDDIDNGDNKPFHGTIDQVVVLQSALNGEQLRQLHRKSLTVSEVVESPSNSAAAWWQLTDAADSATAVDALGHFHGAYDGAKRDTESNDVVGRRFDGFNDSIHLGAVDLGGDAMTILAWFKVDSFRHNDARIISKASGTNNNDHYWMLSTIRWGNRYRLRFRLKTQHTQSDDDDEEEDEDDDRESRGNRYAYGYWKYVDDDERSVAKTTRLTARSGALSAGEWVFAAAVYDGQKMRLYKDGELVGSTRATGRISTNPRVMAAIGDNPPGSPRARFLRDLTRISKVGYELRPFTGSVTAPFSLTSNEDISLLEDELALELVSVEQRRGDAPLTHPGRVTSYRLYPGGKVYHAAAVKSSLRSTSLQPDPRSNPLGLFYSDYGVNVSDSTQLRGTLMTHASGDRGDIEFRGGHLDFAGVSLPPLYGDVSVYQLPVVVARDDVRVTGEVRATVAGAVIAGGDFEFKAKSRESAFGIQGRLLTGGLDVGSSDSWQDAKREWKAAHSDFMRQLGHSSQETEYFPRWMLEHHDLDPTPRFTVQPPPENIVYHWPDWTKPIFVPHPDDGGLRWEVVSWQDLSNKFSGERDKSNGYSTEYDDYHRSMSSSGRDASPATTTTHDDYSGYDSGAYEHRTN